MRSFLPVVPCAAALFLACSSGSSSGSGEACVPGVVASCACPGATGAQACGPDREFGACDCTATGGGLPDPTGQADFLIDFGARTVGDQAEGALPLRNAGTAPLQFQAEPVGAPFAVETTGPTLLRPGDRGQLRWAFRPTAAGTFSSVTRVVSSEGEVTVRLAGVGFEPSVACEPPSVDFGSIWRGQTLHRETVCVNTAAHPWSLAPGTIEGLDADLFRIDPVSPEAVAPGGSWRIRVTVVASRVGLYSAALPLASTTGRPAGKIYLGATAETRALACGPAVVDFGFVAPGSVGHRELVCLNRSPVPIHITELALDASSDQRFSWLPGAPIVVPPADEAGAGRATIDLAYAPGPDGGRRHTGRLVISNDEPSTPQLDVRLTGFAGGPRIECSPTALDFGTVALGVPVTRSFACTNTGTDDPTRNDDGLVVSGFAATRPAEFTVAPRGPLQARGYGIGEVFTVDVTYHPVDEGLDGAEIRVLSNATNGTEAQPYAVAVAGQGRDLPPCDVELAPAQLRFGVVERGHAATLEFAIRNRLAEDECLVRNVRLADTCAAAFSLPTGEVAAAMLPPGGELRVPVRFAPTAYRTDPYTCDVLLDVSDPAQPNRFVPVRGASEESCLLVTPGELDFGVGLVRPGCSAGPRDRELELFNVCTRPLVFSQLELVGADPEFVVVSAPPAGTTIGPGLSAKATLGYHPGNLGADLGAVLVYLEGTPEPHHAAGLFGIGSDEAAQQASFVVNHRPKVDVLLVIDNSDGMADEQAALAANLLAFRSFAQAQEIDFQLGVTTSGMAPAGSGCPGGANGGEAGRLFPVDSSRPRILTPSTPNVVAVWSANVQVGTCHQDEYVLDAAYHALSSPTIDNCDDPRFPQPNDGNCSFLRDDAHLSIVAVTDEAAGPLQAATFYGAAFRALKGVDRPDLFSFHAITGDRGTGCSLPTNTAEAGDTLISLAEGTEGGTFHSICSTDWAATLRDLSAAVFGHPSCYLLPNAAEDTNGDGQVTDGAGELEVRLNGQVVPSVGSQGQAIWRYRPEQRAVCFDPLAQPEPGTGIEVGYRIACGS